MRFFAIADFLDSKRFDEKSKRSTGKLQEKVKRVKQAVGGRLTGRQRRSARR